MDNAGCEFPTVHPGPGDVEAILRTARTIAVVGLSPRPERDSHRVARYLREAGYRIVPVNPAAERILDERSYPSLDEVDVPVDVVQIFRRPDAVPDVVEQAIRIKAKAVWMQVGIVNNAAARRAVDAGLKVVMNRCLMVEHRALNG